MALKSFSGKGGKWAGHIKAPVPSPITPAYARLSGATKKEVVIFQDDVEDACRSFENYLAEMIVEEGKMRDIMDPTENHAMIEQPGALKLLLCIGFGKGPDHKSLLYTVLPCISTDHMATTLPVYDHLP
ncbi:hypothetical protein KY285_028459 [Solanum tuberosum]|nr:hypothetical protein KY285_028459 [Solanum tuberosum]